MRGPAGDIVPDLSFEIEGVEAVRFAVTPQLTFQMGVSNSVPDEAVATVVLRCQIQIEVARRRYGSAEEERLRDLFGEPARWSQTLRTMLWTHVNVVVSPFTAHTTVAVPVPCTYDFNVAATKYFYGLTEGEIPLSFLFSGTVFYEVGEGGLMAAPISWDKEARFRLPVQTWQELMDAYYPNTAWLQLRRDVFDRLYQYKVKRGIPTWEQALENILPPAEDAVQQ